RLVFDVRRGGVLADALHAALGLVLEGEVRLGRGAIRDLLLGAARLARLALHDAEVVLDLLPMALLARASRDDELLRLLRRERDRLDERPRLIRERRPHLAK